MAADGLGAGAETGSDRPLAARLRLSDARFSSNGALLLRWVARRLVCVWLSDDRHTIGTPTSARGRQVCVVEAQDMV